MDVIEYDFSNFSLYVSNVRTSLMKFNVMIDLSRGNKEEVDDNHCLLVTSSDNISKIPSFVEKSIQELKKIGISNIDSNIEVLTFNSNDFESVSKLNDVGNLKFSVQMKSELKENDFSVKNDNKKSPVDLIQAYWTANVITTVNDGVMKSYIQRIGDDNHIGYMLEGLKLRDLLSYFNEIIRKDSDGKKFLSMNGDELTKYILDSYSSENNVKRYYMGGAAEQKGVDEKGKVGLNIAAKNDGVVNQEIGIVQNNPSLSTQFNVVEKSNDKINVVSPNVQSNGVHLEGSDFSISETNSSSFSVDYRDNSVDSKSEIHGEDKEVQKRERPYAKTRILIRPVDKSSGKVSFYIVVGILIIFVLFFIALFIS